MELTNKNHKSFDTNRSLFENADQTHICLTIPEAEALTSILLLSPYLGPTGESALLKLTKSMRSIEKAC